MMLGNQVESSQSLSSKHSCSMDSNHSSQGSGRIRPRPDQGSRLRRSFVSYDKSLGPRKFSNSSNHSFGNTSFKSFNSNSYANSRFNSTGLGSSSSIGSGLNVGFNARNISTKNSAFMQRVPSASGMNKRTPSNSSCLSNCSVASSSSQRRLRGAGVMQMVQRSNAASVKSVIADVQQRCDEFDEYKKSVQRGDNDGNDSISSISSSGTMDQALRLSEQPNPPLQECIMLSHWAVDAYYKVVISKYQGVGAIIRAMRTFSDNSDLQAYCCCALKNLSNKLAIHEAGGTPAVMAAMKFHPQSIHVQSEACEALTALVPILQKEPASTVSEITQELMGLLEISKKMYLTGAGVESVKFLMEFLPSLVPRVPLATCHEPAIDNERMEVDAMEVAM